MRFLFCWKKKASITMKNKNTYGCMWKINDKDELSFYPKAMKLLPHLLLYVLLVYIQSQRRSIFNTFICSPLHLYPTQSTHRTFPFPVSSDLKFCVKRICHLKDIKKILTAIVCVLHKFIELIMIKAGE